MTPVTPNVPRPSAWTSALLRAADRPLPAFRSAAWEALPDRSWTKLAAAAVAAECWHAAGQTIVEDLVAELDAAHAEDQREAWTPDVVEQVHRTADRILRGQSYAELCEKRGEMEKALRAARRTPWRHLHVAPQPPAPHPDARPLKPGNYPGGPVTWEREAPDA